jgi:hypothetical protein
MPADQSWRQIGGWECVHLVVHRDRPPGAKRTDQNAATQAHEPAPGFVNARYVTLSSGYDASVAPEPMWRVLAGK